MSLQEKLNQMKTRSRQLMGEKNFSRMNQVNQRLLASIGKEALKQGDRAPMFELPDLDGRTVRSHDLLQRGPLVISFYRGRW